MAWSINEYKSEPDLNTEINGTDIGENCSPAGINDAIRQIMADIAASGVPDTPAAVVAAQAAAGAAQIAADDAASIAASAADQAGYVAAGLDAHQADPLAHGASKDATAGSLARRGIGGTLAVGEPTAAHHAATKEYVDATSGGGGGDGLPPDGVNLVEDENGKMNLSGGVQATLAKVDTAGTVTEAIAAGGGAPRASQAEVNTGADVNKYVGPKELNEWSAGRIRAMAHIGGGMAAPILDARNVVSVTVNGSGLYTLTLPPGLFTSTNTMNIQIQQFGTDSVPAVMSFTTSSMTYAFLKAGYQNAILEHFIIFFRGGA